MVRSLLILTVVLMLASLACTLSVDLPASRPGETRTLMINERAPTTGNTARLEISMGGGTLDISGGSSVLVSGTVDFNLVEWEPEVTSEDGTVRIKQNIQTIPVPDPERDMINRWNLQLGNTPMELELTAGAYDGTLDFSGVPLTRLKIAGGASNTKIRFDEPNPQPMSRFEFSTGASSAELTGLSNANFEEMIFSGSAGDYELDFSGELQRDARVRVNGAVGDVTLVIPSGRAAQVTLTGDLQEVNARGTWQVNDRVYSIPGSGPVLDIQVDMSIGSLDLISE